MCYLMIFTKMHISMKRTTRMGATTPYFLRETKSALEKGSAINRAKYPPILALPMHLHHPSTRNA